MLNGTEAPPAEFISECLRSGKVIPDESDPWDSSRFHANFQGYESGHTDQESRKRWFEKMNAQLAAFGSWDKVDIHNCDPDYAMTYGDHAMGCKFPFAELKPMIDAERDKMTNIYKSVCDAQANTEPSAWTALTTDPKYATCCTNKDGVRLELIQPTTNLAVLYQGNIAMLPELWRITLTIASAGNSKRCSWSLKKLMRTNKKLQEKYSRRVSRVTDVARTSIVFETIADLAKAYDFALANAKVLRTKNRFIEPELGYSDILLNLMMPNDFIIEVQMHLACIYNMKSQGGHASFKWFRRLLLDEDTYQGAYNKGGQRHGVGILMCANGDEYDGQWRNGLKDGRGIYVEADGHKYDGDFKENNRHGECTFTYFDGSKYVGSYVKDKKEGYGIFTYIDGKAYDGQWFKGKRHGEGTFTYVDGSKYSGAWQMHKRHGAGNYTSPEGESHAGRWRDDDEEARNFLGGFFAWPLCCTCHVEAGETQIVHVETFSGPFVSERDNSGSKSPRCLDLMCMRSDAHTHI